MKDVLLIFARYPQPGKCKTRLIPALGEVGAAELHDRMTRWTLAWARKLAEQHDVAVEVHCAGASPDAMEARFGKELPFVEQSEGDLGQKLKSAAMRSFHAGARRVLIVGTDCPELNEVIASDALRRLDTHDVCLAPASDGGYTLVAIANHHPQRLEGILERLFTDICWSTERVLQQTLERLSSDSMVSISLLPTFADVDTPGDIDPAIRILDGYRAPPPRISVIVPVHGPEDRLELAIRSARTCEQAEVIIAASSSGSCSPQFARDWGAQLVVSKPNRGHQLNTAAASARSDVLLFLHADTELPLGYWEDVQTALADTSRLGGAFSLRVDSSRPGLRWVEKGVGLRSRLLRMPYGDQAIFVRAATFHALAGFAELPIMEDYEFVRRLKRKGRIAILSSCVTTSARRWERLGCFRTTLANQLMISGFHIGISPERLASFYRSRGTSRWSRKK